MARPKKQGLDYFPFNTDFFEDDKIVPVTGEFGLKGEIVAIKLLCAIYRNGYFIEWNERLRLKFLRDLHGVSIGLLDMIISRLVQWGFFDESLFNSEGILTSKGIQRRYFEITNRRLMDHELPYLLVNVNRNPRSKVVSVCGNATKEIKDNISSNESILSSISSTTPTARAYEGENDDTRDTSFGRSIPEEFKSLWENFRGKRKSLVEDYDDFCKKTEGLFVDYVKLQYGLQFAKNIYFQSWINQILPKVTKRQEQTRLPADAIEYIRIEHVAEYLKSDQCWLDALCMNRHLRMDYLLSKIDEFTVELQLQGEVEKDKRDCKRHFNNWLRKNRNSNESTTSHRASNGDITNEEVMRRCQERVAERLAREKAREMGLYNDTVADPF